MQALDTAIACLSSAQENNRETAAFTSPAQAEAIAREDPDDERLEYWNEACRQEESIRWLTALQAVVNDISPALVKTIGQPIVVIADGAAHARLLSGLDGRLQVKRDDDDPDAATILAAIEHIEWPGSLKGRAYPMIFTLPAAEAEELRITLENIVDVYDDDGFSRRVVVVN